jgi:hypothetical protein
MLVDQGTEQRGHVLVPAERELCIGETVEDSEPKLVELLGFRAGRAVERRVA